MPIVNMELVTEVQPVPRRDFELSTRGLIDPNNTGSPSDPIYLLDGEFVGLDANYKIARQGPANAGGGGLLVNPAVTGGVAIAPWYAWWMERGRYDLPAVEKGTVLFGGGYEANFSRDVLNAVETFNVGDPLYINWLSDGADANRRRGLTKVKFGADPGLIHGYVTRVYTSGLYAIRALIVAP